MGLNYDKHKLIKKCLTLKETVSPKFKFQKLNVDQ
jgi:hypothetical protein